MSAETLRAPFPWFGGKRRIAPRIWELLGDPGGYVEPFCGSAAVLLARPPLRGRRVETLNDADGWLVNMWRAVRTDPAGVAEHCWGPVTEIDLHARLAWLQERRDADLVAWLEGDPDVCDVRAAGWWLYVCCASIGNPWEDGPWRVVDGHLRNVGTAGQGIHRGLPHLGNAGRGIHRELPHLGTAGQGIHREPPHLGNAGQGIHRELQRLQARLETVRILCGDWQRPLTPSAVRATAGPPTVGVLLDPPYDEFGDGLYSDDSRPCDAVQDWCLAADRAMRIVVCGYDGQYPELEAAGWTVHRGLSTTGAGMANSTANAQRERLWASPACLSTDHLFTELTP